MPRLRIASLRIALEGPDRPPRGWSSLASFLDRSDGPCDFRLRWRCVEALPNPELEGDTAVEDLPGGVVAFHRRDYEGRLDPASGEGELVTSPTPGSLRSALRFVLSLGLLEKDGFLLHSAGLRKAGLGYVLCGPSGAGKSTAAGLSRPQAEVLSDELCALRRDGAGVWRVLGTPFSGHLEIGLPAEAPLACLAFLEQSPRVEAGALPPAEAVRRLYAQIFRTGRSQDRHARWLSLASGITADVPGFLLRFRRDPSFWAVLEAAAVGRAA